MHAPSRNVMPLVFSMNRLNTAATTTTTMAMVLYSVFMKVAAPLRMMPAISAISAVPSLIFLMRRKLNATYAIVRTIIAKRINQDVICSSLPFALYIYTGNIVPDHSTESPKERQTGKRDNRSV